MSLGDRRKGLPSSDEIIIYKRKRKTSPYRRTSPDSEHGGLIGKRKDNHPAPPSLERQRQVQERRRGGKEEENGVRKGRETMGPGWPAKGGFRGVEHQLSRQRDAKALAYPAPWCRCKAGKRLTSTDPISGSDQNPDPGG